MVAVRERVKPTPVPARGQVVLAYDGTDLAENAIRCAASQLGSGRCVLVVCVWQPADVGFTPTEGKHFDADQADEVRRAAERTAAHGASLAEEAGFRAESIAVEAAADVAGHRACCGGARWRASSCWDRTAAAGCWVTFRGVSPLR